MPVPVRGRFGDSNDADDAVVSHLGGVSCLIECKSVDNISSFFFSLFPSFLRLARADDCVASIRAAMLFICLAAATAAFN